MTLIACSQQFLEIAVRAREKQIHNGEAENNNRKIKDAKLRGTRSAPAGIAGEPQIKNVCDEDEQRDDVFGIVMPDIPGEAVDPHEAENGTDSDGDESHEDAALTHAIEKIKRRQTPDDIANAVLMKQALFAEVHEAEYAGEAERGVGENTERDVKREGDAGGGWCGQAVRRRELGKKEKRQNEWKDKSSDRTLAVKKFEAEVGERKQPAEKRHGAGEVMIGNGVEAASAFEQGEIVGDKAGREKE